jgi:hypothetical protein
MCCVVHLTVQDAETLARLLSKNTSLNHCDVPRLLRSPYRDTLDSALSTQRPDVVHSLLDELAARGGLHSALAGRDAASLLPLLRHLTKHITDPRHSASLSGVAARVLDLYAPVVHTDERVRTTFQMRRAVTALHKMCVGNCVYVCLMHEIISSVPLLLCAA